MRAERFSWHPGVAAELRALVPGGASVAGNVAEIVHAVREGGDAALREFVRRFDGYDGTLRVGAGHPPDGELRAGLEVAIANVRAVAQAGVGSDVLVELPQGHSVLVRELPVRRAAIYVPGGRAPYPSTVVMGVVTAQAAGVEEVVVCAPGAHPVILAACALCGVDEVYAMGGAHAVAALAYGTESIERVDVIAGPGNLYVQEAKRQCSSDVGIDGFAGPSDVLVLATGADRPWSCVARSGRAGGAWAQGRSWWPRATTRPSWMRSSSIPVTRSRRWWSCRTWRRGSSWRTRSRRSIWS